MTTTRTEKKNIDRKASPAGLRTLSTQMLVEVAGGRGYLTYTMHDVIISGYSN